MTYITQYFMHLQVTRFQTLIGSYKDYIGVRYGLWILQGAVIKDYEYRGYTEVTYELHRDYVGRCFICKDCK